MSTLTKEDLDIMLVDMMRNFNASLERMNEKIEKSTQEIAQTNQRVETLSTQVETSNYVFFDDVLRLAERFEKQEKEKKISYFKERKSFFNGEGSNINSNNSNNEGKMIVVTPEQAALAKKVCFKCQGMGHIARDCGNKVTVSKKEHRMLLAYLDHEEKEKESTCLLNTEEEFDFEEFEGQEKITPEPEHHHIGVNLEDIVRKASDYLVESTVLSDGSSLVNRLLMFIKQLFRCEVWLSEKFSVKEFKLLGHGDFFSFLERNSSLLPKALLNFVRGEVHESQLLEVTMIQQQLVTLLSQASSSLWEEGVVTKDKVSELLIRQFPLISFRINESCSTQELLELVGKQRDNVSSNCVIFSATLSGTSKYVDSAGADSRHGADLNSWLHWDLVYAPSLGPLLEWLHSEARQGFEVVMADFLQNMDFSNGHRSANIPRENESVNCHSSVNLVKNLSGINCDVSLASRIFIDCLAFLPSEFRCFAADVLLSGMQSLVKDVASAILIQCKGHVECLKLHEIGFSLGIVGWIHDHHSVCPITDYKSLILTKVPSLTNKGSDVKEIKLAQCSPEKTSSPAKILDLHKNDTDASVTMGGSEVQYFKNNVSHHLAEQDIEKAALVVESIRRD
uniref:CCHC-type domain-containing protein n=1 Tax=Chenopodium quinoa TaxID=63459 RepID=A0A803LTN6_CHEQI